MSTEPRKAGPKGPARLPERRMDDPGAVLPAVEAAAAGDADAQWLLDTPDATEALWKRAFEYFTQGDRTKIAELIRAGIPIPEPMRWVVARLIEAPECAPRRRPNQTVDVDARRSLQRAVQALITLEEMPIPEGVTAIQKRRAVAIFRSNIAQAFAEQTGITVKTAMALITEIKGPQVQRNRRAKRADHLRALQAIAAKNNPFSGDL